MGLADRDYMRENARARAESRGAVFAPSGYAVARRRKRLIAVAVALAVVAVLGFAYVRGHSPGRMGPMQVTVTSPSAPTPLANGELLAAPAKVEFPESGTVEWGQEGQPIGGNLERLDIWDVTRSEQGKVVHIRSGPGSTFAIVYLAPGQRTTIMVPANRAYQVTATSGDRWLGPSERFGTTGTTVNFGMVEVYEGVPGVIAMGAADQTANVVPNDQF